MMMAPTTIALIFYMMLAQGAAQKTAPAEPNGTGFYWTVIVTLAGVVAALAGYIVKLHAEIGRLNEERVKIYREQVEMLTEVKKEVQNQ